MTDPSNHSENTEHAEFPDGWTCIGRAGDMTISQDSLDTVWLTYRGTHIDFPRVYEILGGAAASVNCRISQRQAPRKVLAALNTRLSQLEALGVKFTHLEAQVRAKDIHGMSEALSRLQQDDCMHCLLDAITSYPNSTFSRTCVMALDDPSRPFKWL